MIAAIDFETYYSKTHGVQTLGPVGYAQHPDTDIYMVSIVTSDGLEWVGDPMSEGCPWSEIAGAEWVSHNRSFDLAVFAALNPPEEAWPKVWHCSADLCAYLGVKRDLKTASEILLGVKVDKAPRDKMKGKRWADVDLLQRDEMLAYAFDDSRHCLAIWLGYSDQWPEWEQRLSRQTTRMGHQGVNVDTVAIEKAIKELQAQMADNGARIPWYNTTTDKGKPVPLTSPKAVAAHCHNVGIDPPKSMAKDSEEFETWLTQYGDAHPFAEALGVQRSLNRTVEVLKKMRDFTVEGRMRYGLKYGGAHTLRWSGDGGLNLHNFPRKTKGGVDLRGMITPKPGHTFLNADYSQIEARVSLWIAEDTDQLKMIAGGVDVYEAHARRTMGYKDPRPMSEADPEGRQMAKVRVLGLGYGCGAAKFVAVAAAMGGVTLTPAEAKRVVTEFRRTNKGLVDWWDKLFKGLKLQRGGTFQMTLPSGRVMEYFNVTNDQGWRCEMVRGAGLRYVYGGLLFENLIQGIARDLLGHHLNLLEDLGGYYEPVLHIHDEFLFEVPESEADAAKQQLEQTLTALPDWADGLPIEADVRQLDRYTK
jgi:DNA polymerase I-like protein with 3'-5' exonuclease and polymerase domains